MGRWGGHVAVSSRGMYTTNPSQRHSGSTLPFLPARYNTHAETVSPISPSTTPTGAARGECASYPPQPSCYQFRPSEGAGDLTRRQPTQRHSTGPCSSGRGGPTIEMARSRVSATDSPHARALDPPQVLISGRSFGFPSLLPARLYSKSHPLLSLLVLVLSDSHATVTSE